MTLEQCAKCDMEFERISMFYRPDLLALVCYECDLAMDVEESYGEEQ